VITLVLSGGQTGVDQGALRAAKACGVPTGGWVPADWATEDGPAPWLAEYGLKATPYAGYVMRTRANVADCHGLLWVGDPGTPGGKLTLRYAGECGKPILQVRPGDEDPVAAAAAWAAGSVDGPVLCAGNRERNHPGIGAWAEWFFTTLFTRPGVARAGG
jgi:hypothetical protein